MWLEKSANYILWTYRRINQAENFLIIIYKPKINPTTNGYET